MGSPIWAPQFGRTGNSFTRSKGVMKDYAETKFIEKVTPTYVDFVMHSRPFFLSIFSISRTTASGRGWRVWPSIFRSPTFAGLAIGSGNCPPSRSATAFRAAGFSPAEVDGYTRVVMQRIAALKKL